MIESGRTLGEVGEWYLTGNLRFVWRKNTFNFDAGYLRILQQQWRLDDYNESTNSPYCSSLEWRDVPVEEE